MVFGHRQNIVVVQEPLGKKEKLTYIKTVKRKKMNQELMVVNNQLVR